MRRARGYDRDDRGQGRRGAGGRGAGGREPDGRRGGGLAGRARPGPAGRGHGRRAQRGRGVRRRAQALVLHPDRSRRPAQQRLAFRLVASGLSIAGYNTVATIVGLDNVLDLVEGWRVDWGRERGRDPGLYYLRVFGEPGGAAPWGWRFGGHHVSLNNLVAD